MEGQLHFVMLSLFKNCFLFQKFMSSLATLIIIFVLIMILHIHTGTWEHYYIFLYSQVSSVQLLSCVSLRCHEPQHTRPPYPLWIPGVHPNHWVDSNAHWVGDAIQPSHPLSSPSSPALNLSQHQGLFQWVSSSHEVAKVLAFQLQHQSFQWTPRNDLL